MTCIRSCAAPDGIGVEQSFREPSDVRSWAVNFRSVAGRVARSGSAVYNATKHGVGAFSEGLRQEVTGRHVRVSLVEPGGTDTELAGHNRPEVLPAIKKRFEGVERLQAADVADAIGYIVTRPRHVAVNEILNDKPETINEDAFGDGWIFLVRASDRSELDELLDADAYAELVENEDH